MKFLSGEEFLPGWEPLAYYVTAERRHLGR